MPKPRRAEKETTPEPKPIDAKNRRAFLHELDGHIQVDDEETPAGKHIRVTQEVDTVVAEPPPPPPDLKSVLGPDAAGGPSKRSTFEKGKRRTIWPWIVGGLVLLAAVSTTGYIFLTRSDKFTESSVDLRLEISDEARSGDSLTLTVRYANNGTVGLRDAELALTYPSGFTVTASSVEASNDFRNSFSIPDLDAGEVGQMTVTGRLLGAVDTEHEFAGALSYRPTNFNSIFVARDTASTTITTSILDLKIEGPEKLSPNGNGKWTITVTNAATEDLEDIQVEVTVPTGIKISSANPAASEGTTNWRIDRLSPEKSQTIVVEATVSGQAGDSLSFGVTAGLVGTNGTVERQAETSFLTAIVTTGLTVSVAANGQTENGIIQPGEPITYSIKIENTNDAEISDATVEATFTGEVLELAKRQGTSTGTLKDGVVTWTKEEVDGLKLIKTGQSVTITLTVPTNTPAPAKNDGDKNPKAGVSVAVTAPDLPGTPTPTVRVMSVATKLTFVADARYRDDQGEVLGSGPVPPKVGQTTAYRIIWSVSTTTNDIDTFSVSTVLPTSVFWTGKNINSDAGDLTFDPVSRAVTWTINKVPFGTGSRLPLLRVWFEVSITPSADQVGSIVVLTEAVTAGGTDAGIGDRVSTTVSSLSSDVPNDPFAAGEGTVQP